MSGKLYKILALIIVLAFIYLILKTEIGVFLGKSKIPVKLEISKCIPNGTFEFPEKISGINITQRGDSLIVYVDGEGLCKRAINSSPQNVIVVYKYNGKKYISSREPLVCKDKRILNLNISVECCSDKDCNGLHCINFVCQSALGGKVVYKFIYPLFYKPTNIPACKGAIVDSKTIVGENVGDMCYSIEDKNISYEDLGKGCVWVDGIRRLTIYGTGRISLELKDYYGNPKMRIEDNISGEKTYVLNYKVIRYICLLQSVGNLDHLEVTTYRYKIYQKESS